MTNRQSSLGLIAASFFGWGVLRALNDILVAAHQIQYPLHDAEAMLLHCFFFAAYLLFPIPSAWMIRRRGLGSGLSAATGTMGAAAVLCAFSLLHLKQPPYLIYFFAIAAGIAIMQTAGNPGATLLGHPATAARRLLAVQSVLALGSAIVPLCIGLGHPVTALAPATILARAGTIYTCTGILLLTLTIVFIARSDDALESKRAMEETPSSRFTLDRPMIFAIMMIFLFVGTEATVLTHILQYQWTFSPAKAGYFWNNALSVYWLVVMLGRAGTYLLLRRFRLTPLLRISGLAGTGLVLAAVLLSGQMGLTALLLTGFVNATIFPLVFCLSTESLDAPQLATASGWLMTAMCGGAVIPLISGAMADRAGLKAAFIVPILSYLWIACMASRCRRQS